jgi:DNA-binding response OmpR family regulator
MPKKILVVDDSATILMMVKTFLGRERYVLLTASNGEEAVAKARKEAPDLVLMDVMMPKMTGLEACQELRRHPETASLPVILVTTRGEPESIQRGFESGCTDYVTKPIDGQQLLARIETCLGKA